MQVPDGLVTVSPPVRRKELTGVPHHALAEDTAKSSSGDRQERNKASVLVGFLCWGELRQAAAWQMVISAAREESESMGYRQCSSPEHRVSHVHSGPES